MTLLEILEEVAKHHDAFDQWCEEEEMPRRRRGKTEERPGWVRTLELYYAQNFILKAKVDGWKLFCERLGIAPFGVWQYFPGIDRLQGALKSLEANEYRPAPVFQPDGMVAWMSRIRPKEAPRLTVDRLISPEKFANDLDKAFRIRVEWWGGKA